MSEQQKVAYLFVTLQNLLVEVHVGTPELGKESLAIEGEEVVEFPLGLELLEQFMYVYLLQLILCHLKTGKRSTFPPLNW